MEIHKTISQFTGLLDKNGVKIFEGDIYHHGEKKILYEVVWRDGGFQGKQIGSYGCYAGVEYWLSQINVIGNIFDNPDLLKGVER